MYSFFMFCMDRFIAVIDLETTSLSTKDTRIVEVGIARLDTITGEVEKLLDVVVKDIGFCEDDRKAWVFKNTNLKFEDVMNAEPLDKYRTRIQEILFDYQITAYNTDFDFKILIAHGFKIKRPLPCLMRSAAPIVKNNPTAWRVKFQAAWDFFNKESNYDEVHRGFDDAAHEAQFAFQLINYFKENKIDFENQ